MSPTAFYSLFPFLFPPSVVWNFRQQNRFMVWKNPALFLLPAQAAQCLQQPALLRYASSRRLSEVSASGRARAPGGTDSPSARPALAPSPRREQENASNNSRSQITQKPSEQPKESQSAEIHTALKTFSRKL